MNRRVNRILARRAAGATSLGLVVQSSSPEVVEITGSAGLDFVVLDGEHGAGDFAQLVHLMRAADASGMAALVRTAGPTPEHIPRLLDAGAMGVVVPHVTDADQARALVAAAKYRTPDSPWGQRGSCPTIRATGHFCEDWEDFARWSNANTLVWFIIEDRASVENIEEILALPGIDGVVPGRFDLAQALGHGNRIDHPEVHAALARVSAAARARGIAVAGALMGTQAAHFAEQTAYWHGLGASNFWIGGDRGILSLALRGRRDLVLQAMTPADT